MMMLDCVVINYVVVVLKISTLLALLSLMSTGREAGVVSAV
jgi:hypothetical protein